MSLRFKEKLIYYITAAGCGCNVEFILNNFTFKQRHVTGVHQNAKDNAKIRATLDYDVTSSPAGGATDRDDISPEQLLTAAKC